MAETVREALRDRMNVRAVISWVVLFGVLLWVFDEPTLQVGMSLLTAAVLGVVELLSEVYDLRSEVGSLALGGVGLLGASALVVFGGALGLVLLLISGWITLDAGQTLRHEGLKKPPERERDRDGHEVYYEYVTRQVGELLRERALTRRELSVALEADDTAVDRAIATLDERGLLTRRGSELRVSSPPKPGVFGRVRGGTERVLGRLVRPLAVEFEDVDDAATARRPLGESTSDGDRRREREPAGRR